MATQSRQRAQYTNAEAYCEKENSICFKTHENVISADTHSADSIRLRAGCECYRRWLFLISEDIDILRSLSFSMWAHFGILVFSPILSTIHPVVEQTQPINGSMLIL